MRLPSRVVPARAPRAATLPTVLDFARRAIWLLVLNCVQNLLLAPRATASVADLRRLKGRRPPGPWPLVSILVPARDEAANIAGCLRGLLAQSYPAVEIIVCDDRSGDDTAAIVRALAGERGNGRLRLLPGHPRPSGWSGKNWACHQLAEAARGDWLLFIDADTRAGPEAVAATLALAWEHGADLVSLLPRHRTGTWGERLLVTQLPLIVFAILPLALVPHHAPWARPFAGANGLFLFFHRGWYDRVGGYPAVREAIAEDMRFAAETKRRGGRLVLADGGAVLACRMYRGFADAWRGCSRNAFPAALESPAAFLAFTVAWAVLFALPPVVLLWEEGVVRVRVGRWAPGTEVPARGSLRSPRNPCLEGAQRVGTGAGRGPSPRRGTSWPQAPGRDFSPGPRRFNRQPSSVSPALAATVGQLVVRFLVGRRAGWPLWEVPLQPLSSLLTLALLLNSYRLHRLGGGFHWRGRRYA